MALPRIDKVDPLLPARLRALPQLVRGEKQIWAAVMEALGIWLPAVEDAVLDDKAPPLVAATPDPNRSAWAAPLWQSLIEKLVLPAALGLYDAQALAWLSSHGVHGIDTSEARAAYLAEITSRLTLSVQDETFTAIRRALAEGMSLGESIPEIRDRVQRLLDLNGEADWQGRATGIARTEAVGAYNGGTVAAGRAFGAVTGEPLYKLWVATRDASTRQSHQDVDDAVVPVDSPFSVGGFSLDRPGDPRGPAAEVINCRCTVSVLTADELALLGERPEFIAPARITEPDGTESNATQRSRTRPGVRE